MKQKPLSISHISDDLKTVTPIQMYPPIIPNLRDTQDHAQWHTMLEMLQYGDTDVLIPKYIIEYFETVYQRRLVVPNDCMHIEVDSNRKSMKVPATCYHDMSLMYSEECARWYTFIQSVKRPDKVAVIHVYIKAPDYVNNYTEETCCGQGWNILADWTIEFPFLHRYIQHYNKSLMHPHTDLEHSMGQISKFNNLLNNMMVIHRPVSKSYSFDPTLDQDILDLQNKIMKQAIEEYTKNFTLKIKPRDTDWI